jgi:hypothetical protein
VTSGEHVIGSHSSLHILLTLVAFFLVVLRLIAGFFGMPIVLTAFI